MVSHSHDKNKKNATAQHKIFDIILVSQKTAKNNLYDLVKTPSISNIY